MGKISNRWGIIVWVTILLCLSPAAGRCAEPLGKRIALDSGMVLLLAERHEIPMVTVNMAIKAGSIAEPADKPGLASLTASLLMQGTKRRTASQISGEIDFIGGSLSVSAGEDFASASLRVLKKDLRTGFDLLADVLMNPRFDQGEIDRKIKETLASIRQSKEDPEVIAQEAFAKAVFGEHPYGRTSDEAAASLPKLTARDLREFHAERYAPNTAIIAVVGDVTEKEAVALISEYFRDWTKREAGTPAAPKPPKEETTRLIKIDKEIAQANIALGHLGISRENPDYYAVSVMNYILGGGGFTSRLMDNVRDNRGLAYDVHSVFEAQKEPGAFRVWVQTKNESANEALGEIFKELRRIRSELVTEGELADAKAYLTGSFPLRMDTSSKIAGMLASVEIYNLGLDYPHRYPGLINAVTREEILRVAQKYLDPDRMVVVILADQKKASVANPERR